MVSIDLQRALVIYFTLALFLTIGARSTGLFSTVSEDLVNRFVTISGTGSNSSVVFNNSFTINIFNVNLTVEPSSGLIGSSLSAISFLFGLGSFLIDIVFAPYSLFVSFGLTGDAALLISLPIGFIFMIAVLGFVFGR